MSQCRALACALPGRVLFPDSPFYNDANHYWSNRQAETRPVCFVRPLSTRDVSKAMKILTESRSPFAVKGGGHTAFAGGSNIDGGVTIDLLHLNTVTVSPDRKTVSVGSGNRWINVSEALDPLGLAVVGGREWDVGVPGLILGGGISYFSGKYGWACDNVRNFEVVLSSGRIVDASPWQNQDLYWALRGGGGSNWGIVTRFDLAAFDQGGVWSNNLIFPGAASRSMIGLFKSLAVDGLAQDEEAHTYMVATHVPALGGDVIAGFYYHATPPAEGTFPRVFQPVNSQPGAIVNTTSVLNISALSKTIDDPYGSRKTWWDTTVRLDEGSEALLENVMSRFTDFSERLRAQSESAGSRAILALQPISPNILQHMQKNGGNALGLHPEDGPLAIIQLSVSWESASLDAWVEDGAAQFVASIEEMAETEGLLKGYVYMNYAGKTQDVLGRYGTENYERLTRIAKHWDPDGHLQSLWKGYFQLGRST